MSRREYARKYYKENREKILAQRKIWYDKNKVKLGKQNRKYIESRKRKVFEHYGGSKCGMCEIDDFDVLTVDHINCGGTKHRRSFKNYDGQAIYRWIIKNNFPKGFRILCRNCNWKEHLRLNFGVHK